MVLNPQYFFYDSCLTSYHFSYENIRMLSEESFFLDTPGSDKIKEKKTNAMQQVGLIKDTLSVEPDTQKNYLAVGVGKEF